MTSHSLIEKFHQASGFNVADIEKEDLPEVLLDLYKNDDKKAMDSLFKEYANFLFRGSAQVEDAVVERAKGNIRFISYVADLMTQNCSLFEALDKAAKQNKDLRCGPVVDFFRDSIHNYALVKMSGFRVMYNGALYSRRVRSEDSSDSIYEFLLMNRYTVPTRRKMVECLEQHQQRSPCFRVTEDDVSSFFAARKIIPEKDYLDFAYGSLPSYFLHQNIDNIKGLYWYELALRREAWKNQPQFGIQWSLRSLPYHHRLPPRNSVKMEDFPELEGKDANKNVDALYAALPTPQHFANVLDSSTVRLEYFALELLESLKGRFPN